MNRNLRKKKSPLHRVLDIIIGVLCVFIVLAAVLAIGMFKESWSYSYETDSFYYRLQDEAFGQMVEMYYTNEAAGVKADEELQQYYGVAKYFEAASYYKAYQDVEDGQQMLKYQEKMELAEEEMGELDFLSEKIYEKLGIE